MVAPARSVAQRVADTQALLAREVDAWFATSDGSRPWLVPLTIAWHDGLLVAVTSAGSRTVRNLLDHPDVRVSLGHTRDVVLVDGRAEIAGLDDLSPGTLARLTDQLGSDPRSWADAAIVVRPERVQAWREENELPDRVIFRDGAWVEEPAGPSPADTPAAGRVRQLRLVVHAEDYAEAVRFFRDVVGMPQEEAYAGDGGAEVVILGAGRATLEIANTAQVEMIDEVEVGRRVAPRMRLALEVADAATVSRDATLAGAALVSPPTQTPWRSLNARLDAPGGIHLTIFEELGEPPGEA